MVLIYNPRFKGPKTDGNLLSLQALGVAVIVHFHLKKTLLLCRGSLDDHSVSVR